MGERKVLNKYYPPDFDPAKVPRRKMPKDRQYVVRLMAPFNMRCLTCGEYIYKGKKFNAKKETCLDEEYLGLSIFRFYIRCNQCASEIAFKTDPKNTDYVCEIGASRNFENWREAPAEDEADVEARGETEEQNPMLALEKRTEESKQEMDIMDNLEEIKDLNARKMNVNIDQLLAAKEEAKQELLAQRREKKLKKIQEEDDAAVSAAFGSEMIKRLDSSSDEDVDEGPAPAGAGVGAGAGAGAGPAGGGSGSGGSADARGKAKAIIRKRGVNLGPAAAEAPKAKKAKLGGMLGGLKGLIKKKAPVPASAAAAAGDAGGAGGSKSTQGSKPEPAATAAPGLSLLGSDYSDSSDSN